MDSGWHNGSRSITQWLHPAVSSFFILSLSISPFLRLCVCMCLCLRTLRASDRFQLKAKWKLMWAGSSNTFVKIDILICVRHVRKSYWNFGVHFSKILRLYNLLVFSQWQNEAIDSVNSKCIECKWTTVNGSNSNAKFKPQMAQAKYDRIAFGASTELISSERCIWTS